MVPSLAAQAATLVEAAPQNGIPATAMQQVASVLTQVAQNLDHLQYTILRYPDGGWLTARLVETSPETEPISHLWIPAFGHLEDAQAALAELREQAPELEAASFQVLELLLLSLGFSRAEGIVFYDQAGERRQGKAVNCRLLVEQINQALRQVTPPPLA